MKKFFPLFLLGLMSLCSMMFGDMGDSEHDKDQSTSKEAKQDSLLYVLMAKYGELKKDVDGEFQLTIPRNKMENFLGFTDRPQRRVERRISRREFQKNWRKGVSKSYEEDPPNAALIVDGDLQVVVLKSFKTTSRELVFSVGRDGHESLFEVKGPVILFIDSESIANTIGQDLTCGVTLGGAGCP